MKMKSDGDALVTSHCSSPGPAAALRKKISRAAAGERAPAAARLCQKKSFTRVVSRYGEGKNYSASALPIAVQAASASSSGASQQMTLSVKRLMFASSQALLPGAHPLAVAPAVGAEQGDALAAECCSCSRRTSARTRSPPAPRSPWRGSQRRWRHNRTERRHPPDRGSAASASAPAAFMPSRTALAMASVLPVPLQ